MSTAPEYATKLRFLPAELSANIHTFTRQSINEGVTLLAFNSTKVERIVDIPVRVPRISAANTLINRIRSDTKMADFMTNVTMARQSISSTIVEISNSTTLNAR